MRRSVLAIVVLALAAPTACVTKKEYLRLQDEYGRSVADGTAREGGLKRDIEALQGRLAACEKAKALVEDDLAACQKGSKDLSVEKSRLLREYQSLSASADEMRAALAELQKRKEQADARLKEFQDLLNRFKPLIDAGKLKVAIVDGRMVVQLPSDVLFKSGQAVLDKDGLAAVQEVAGVLIQIPGRRYQVEGHTDDRPIRTAAFPSNWELAAARALTVIRTMIDAGLAPDRISAASCGEFKPARPNDTPEGRSANRRIEIVVVPDLSGLPGFEELSRVGQ